MIYSMRSTECGWPSVKPSTVASAKTSGGPASGLSGDSPPEFRAGQWTADLRGITHLSRLHEVTFLDAIQPVVPVRLSSFPTCILTRDVYDHVHGAIDSLTGLRDCGDADLSDCFNAINARGGFKAMIYRRGLQAP